MRDSGITEFLIPLIGFNETMTKETGNEPKKCSNWTNSCRRSDAIPKVMGSTRTGSLKSDIENTFPQSLLFLAADQDHRLWVQDWLKCVRFVNSITESKIKKENQLVAVRSFCSISPNNAASKE